MTAPLTYQNQLPTRHPPRLHRTTTTVTTNIAPRSLVRAAYTEYGDIAAKWIILLTHKARDRTRACVGFPSHDGEGRCTRRCLLTLTPSGAQQETACVEHKVKRREPVLRRHHGCCAGGNQPARESGPGGKPACPEGWPGARRLKWSLVLPGARKKSNITTPARSLEILAKTPQTGHTAN